MAFRSGAACLSARSLNATNPHEAYVNLRWTPHKLASARTLVSQIPTRVASIFISRAWATAFRSGAACLSACEAVGQLGQDEPASG